jgi:hypothetical protein
MSSSLPVAHPSPTVLHSLGHDNVINRGLVNFFGVATNFVYNHLAYPASRFAGNKDAAEAHSKTLDDLVVGDGFIGIREQKQEAMNVESIVPATRSASRMRLTKELHVPKDYDAFLEKYPKTILVAFGTTWQPSKKFIIGLVEAAKELKEFGFILSLQEKWEVHQIAKEANLPNINL